MKEYSQLVLKMMEHEEGCPQRIQHFLKVWAFARLIGELEALDEDTMKVLEIAAVVHDIGIKPSLEKYGNAKGSYQELEGPPIAEQLLASLGWEPDVIDRVCYLVGRHHTYDDVDGVDYRILVEADFLVNIFESGMGPEEIKDIRRRIFRTEGGREIFDRLYVSRFDG